MLYLIQRNRIGKNIINKGDNAFNWREAFKASEDSLTSSVFSLLFYLPVDLFWEILFKACYYPTLPRNSGKLISYEFWPHWNCKDTENSSYIEPDLFLEFESFHLIIEAKRYDFIQQQNKSQWEAQIIAYRNEYSENQRKPLYLIALAGILNGDEKQSPVLSISIITCRWAKILYEINNMILKQNKSERTDSVKNILNDLVRSFTLHGFRAGSLFESFPQVYNIKKVPNLSLRIKFVKLKRLNLINFPTSLRNINYSIKTFPL